MRMCIPVLSLLATFGVMPGHTSDQAIAGAIWNHPGFVVGSVRRVSR